jgi:hypothetical protein
MKMPRSVFGRKRREVTRGVKKLHYAEAGHVACMGEKCIQTLGGNPEGKKPLGRYRRKWENNIKMDLTDID